VFDEFHRFTTKVSSMGHGIGNLRFTKKVALMGFESLEMHGLVKFEQGVGGKCPKEYRMARSLLTLTQIKFAMKSFPGNLPAHVKRW
jgi:hypothetical protein